MVYNTFPWPVDAGAEERVTVEAAARGVLDIRGRWPRSTLAQLYDPRTMPASLARAHGALDRAVDRCYQWEAFVSDKGRFAHALKRYQALVARGELADASDGVGTRVGGGADRQGYAVENGCGAPGRPGTIDGAGPATTGAPWVRRSRG
ncbi:type IIL restriction-modification enzyme MmeI [Nannocystis sp.]|uniref:type IIL restriction-modification enzyme MmeI n=1 Tax=Nannocystis sp. TaxID=1962667 RepID=UPI003450A471